MDGASIKTITSEEQGEEGDPHGGEGLHPVPRPLGEPGAEAPAVPVAPDREDVPLIPGTFQFPLHEEPEGRDQGREGETAGLLPDGEEEVPEVPVQDLEGSHGHLGDEAELEPGPVAESPNPHVQELPALPGTVGPGRDEEDRRDPDEVGEAVPPRECGEDGRGKDKEEDTEEGPPPAEREVPGGGDGPPADGEEGSRHAREGGDGEGHGGEEDQPRVLHTASLASPGVMFTGRAPLSRAARRYAGGRDHRAMASGTRPRGKRTPSRISQISSTRGRFSSSWVRRMVIPLRRSASRPESTDFQA